MVLEDAESLQTQKCEHVREIDLPRGSNADLAFENVSQSHHDISSIDKKPINRNKGFKNNVSDAFHNNLVVFSMDKNSAEKSLRSLIYQMTSLAIVK